ncbi:MAG: hypothetical protein EZS28_016447 [Streblomastix strix]|uniref:Uncharacterized protein n=1 Tax=Streblomastix strix TaxID=222440 RepID=A0A5J4VZD5_9EUKA|nr:MAG: hypothetical protein EZS28_016447 [Streblomastix strix]
MALKPVSKQPISQPKRPSTQTKGGAIIPQEGTEIKLKIKPEHLPMEDSIIWDDFTLANEKWDGNVVGGLYEDPSGLPPLPPSVSDSFQIQWKRPQEIFQHLQFPELQDQPHTPFVVKEQILAPGESQIDWFHRRRRLAFESFCTVTNIPPSTTSVISATEAAQPNGVLEPWQNIISLFMSIAHRSEKMQFSFEDVMKKEQPDVELQYLDEYDAAAGNKPYQEAQPIEIQVVKDAKKDKAVTTKVELSTQKLPSKSDPSSLQPPNEATSLNVQSKGPLAPQLLHEKEAVPDYLWGSIYPQNDQFIPQPTQSGKYSIKLFVGGEWRCITVDDRLPVAVRIVQEESSSIEQLKEAVGQLGIPLLSVNNTKQDAQSVAQGKNIQKQIITNSPQIQKGSQTQLQPKERQISPTGEQGDESARVPVTTLVLLLPVIRSQESQRIEIWPALLCKALCKLASGCEETIVGGGGPALVSWLCGVIPHTVTPHITQLPPDIIIPMMNSKNNLKQLNQEQEQQPWGAAPTGIKQQITKKDSDLRGKLSDYIDPDGFEFYPGKMDGIWWEFLQTLLEGDDPALPFFGVKEAFLSKQETMAEASVVLVTPEANYQEQLDEQQKVFKDNTLLQFLNQQETLNNNLQQNQQTSPTFNFQQIELQPDIQPLPLNTPQAPLYIAYPPIPALTTSLTPSHNIHAPPLLYARPTINRDRMIEGRMFGLSMHHLHAIVGAAVVNGVRLVKLLSPFSHWLGPFGFNDEKRWDSRAEIILGEVFFQRRYPKEAPTPEDIEAEVERIFGQEIWFCNENEGNKLTKSQSDNLQVITGHDIETINKNKNMSRRDRQLVIRGREGGRGIQMEEKKTLEDFERRLMQHFQELQIEQDNQEMNNAREFTDLDLEQDSEGDSWGSYQNSQTSSDQSEFSERSDADGAQGLGIKEKESPQQIINRIANKAISDIELGGMLGTRGQLRDHLFAIVERIICEAEAAQEEAQQLQEEEEDQYEDDFVLQVMKKRRLEEEQQQQFNQPKQIKAKDRLQQKPWLRLDGLPVTSLGKPLQELPIPVQLTMDFKNISYSSHQHTFWMPWTEFLRFFEEWDLYHNINELFIKDTPFLTEKGNPILDKGDGTQVNLSAQIGDQNQVENKLDGKEKSGDKQGSGIGEGKPVGKGKEIQIIPEGPPVIPGLPQELHSVAQQCLIQDIKSPLVPPGNDPARIITFVKTTVPIIAQQSDVDQSVVSLSTNTANAPAKIQEDKSMKGKDVKKVVSTSPPAKIQDKTVSQQLQTQRSTKIIPIVEEQQIPPIPLPLPSKFESLPQKEQIKKIRLYRRTNASNFHPLTQLFRAKFSELPEQVTLAARTAQESAQNAAQIAAALERGEKLDKQTPAKVGLISKESAVSAIANSSAGMGFLPRHTPSEPLQLAVGQDSKKGRILLFTLEVVPPKGPFEWKGNSVKNNKPELPVIIPQQQPVSKSAQAQMKIDPAQDGNQTSRSHIDINIPDEASLIVTHIPSWNTSQSSQYPILKLQTKHINSCWLYVPPNPTTDDDEALMMAQQVQQQQNLIYNRDKEEDEEFKDREKERVKKKNPEDPSQQQVLQIPEKPMYKLFEVHINAPRGYRVQQKQCF